MYFLFLQTVKIFKLMFVVLQPKKRFTLRLSLMEKIGHNFISETALLNCAGLPEGNLMFSSSTSRRPVITRITFFLQWRNS